MFKLGKSPKKTSKCTKSTFASLFLSIGFSISGIPVIAVESIDLSRIKVSRKLGNTCARQFHTGAHY